MTTTDDRPARTRNLPPVPGLHDPLPADARAEIPEDRIALVRKRMVERITEVAAEANGNDEATVTLFAQEVALATAWLSMMEEHRDAAAARLRARGVPMTKIAKLARVSDSYLARRLFNRGVKRKIVRGVLTVAAIGGGLAAAIAAAQNGADPTPLLALTP